METNKSRNLLIYLPGYPNYPYGSVQSLLSPMISCSLNIYYSVFNFVRFQIPLSPSLPLPLALWYGLSKNLGDVWSLIFHGEDDSIVTIGKYKKVRDTGIICLQIYPEIFIPPQSVPSIIVVSTMKINYIVKKFFNIFLHMKAERIV